MKVIDIEVCEDPERVETKLKPWNYYQVTYLGQVIKRLMEEDPYTKHEVLVTRSYYRFLIQGGNRA